MSDGTVLHATFTFERFYQARPARVFAAWAEPEAKARWFAGPGAEHELDFRIGGREICRGGHEGGPPLTFESLYRDILPDQRIVYTSIMSAGDALATVSLTTVEFEPSQGGARLVLTEQGAYLDGREDPAWREQGTAQWLDALAAELDRRDQERAR